MIPRRSRSGLFNLDAHHLSLAIAKKTLDGNHFMTAQKTIDREPPPFKINDRIYFKSKQPGKWDLNGDLDTELSVLSAMEITYTLKIKPLEKQGHATSKMQYLNHQ